MMNDQLLKEYRASAREQLALMDEMRELEPQLRAALHEQASARTALAAIDLRVSQLQADQAELERREAEITKRRDAIVAAAA